MRRRRRNHSEPDGCLIAIAVIIGIPAFLLMTHPVIFWVLFVPLVVVGIISFIAWLKK